MTSQFLVKFCEGFVRIHNFSEDMFSMTFSENYKNNIFLHKFLKSDPDDLHDHPWPYFTFILCGGYWEYTPKGKFWRGPLTFRWNRAKSLHRIELDPNVKNCWTLFIPGPKQREWGFVTKDGWVHNENYLNNRKNSPNMYKED